MQKYKLLADGGVVREDGAHIPECEGNRDWKEYQAWLAEGNTPDPADEPVAAKVTEVTIRQARLQLLAMGLLSTVDQFIASMPGPRGMVARVEWEFAATVKHDNESFQSILAGLKFTLQEVDTFFEQAAAL